MAGGLSRRQLLALAPLATRPLRAQGVASRGVRAQPRAKASGLPFHARFTDVAKDAGLTQPTVYGSPDDPRYILETIGCGAAFIDYDNDGWLDIFVLNGRTLDAVPEGATNRLYRNNRDGTFTDVTEEAGLVRHGWACGVCVGDYNNSGHDDLFVTYWGQNVLYRNNADGTFTDVTEEAGLSRPDVRWGSGCTFLDYNRSGGLGPVRRQLLGVRLRNGAAAPASRRSASGRACPSCAAPAACGAGTTCSTATTAMAPSPTSASLPASRPPPRAMR